MPRNNLTRAANGDVSPDWLDTDSLSVQAVSENSHLLAPQERGAALRESKADLDPAQAAHFGLGLLQQHGGDFTAAEKGLLQMVHAKGEDDHTPEGFYELVAEWLQRGGPAPESFKPSETRSAMRNLIADLSESEGDVSLQMGDLDIEVKSEGAMTSGHVARKAEIVFSYADPERDYVLNKVTSSLQALAMEDEESDAFLKDSALYNLNYILEDIPTPQNTQYWEWAEAGGHTDASRMTIRKYVSRAMDMPLGLPNREELQDVLRGVISLTQTEPVEGIEEEKALYEEIRPQLEKVRDAIEAFGAPAAVASKRTAQVLDPDEKFPVIVAVKVGEMEDPESSSEVWTPDDWGSEEREAAAERLMANITEALAKYGFKPDSGINYSPGAIATPQMYETFSGAEMTAQQLYDMSWDGHYSWTEGNLIETDDVLKLDLGDYRAGVDDDTIYAEFWFQSKELEEAEDAYRDAENEGTLPSEPQPAEGSKRMAGEDDRQNLKIGVKVRTNQDVVGKPDFDTILRHKMVGGEEPTANVIPAGTIGTVVSGPPAYECKFIVTKEGVSLSVLADFDESTMDRVVVSSKRTASEDDDRERLPSKRIAENDGMSDTQLAGEVEKIIASLQNDIPKYQEVSAECVKQGDKDLAATLNAILERKLQYVEMLNVQLDGMQEPKATEAARRMLILTRLAAMERGAASDDVNSEIRKLLGSEKQLGDRIGRLVAKIEDTESELFKRLEELKTWCIDHVMVLTGALDARTVMGVLTQIAKTRRPPKEWWDKMVKDVKKGNPDYSEDQVDKTIGNIWFNELSDSEREKILDREGKGQKTDKKGGLVRVTRQQVASICPACAAEMAKQNVPAYRVSQEQLAAFFGRLVRASIGG